MSLVPDRSAPPSREYLGLWYVAALKAHKWDIRDIVKGYRYVGIIMIIAGLLEMIFRNEESWLLVAFGCLNVYFGFTKMKTTKRLDRRIEIARDDLGINVDEVPDYSSNDVTGWHP